MKKRCLVMSGGITISMNFLPFSEFLIRVMTFAFPNENKSTWLSFCSKKIFMRRGQIIAMSFAPEGHELRQSISHKNITSSVIFFRVVFREKIRAACFCLKDISPFYFDLIIVSMMISVHVRTIVPKESLFHLRFFFDAIAPMNSCKAVARCRCFAV